jgi:hypothetical protein
MFVFLQQNYLLSFIIFYFEDTAADFLLIVDTFDEACTENVPLEHT